MTQRHESPDELYMRRALTLADRAHPTPNPKVGAVIVRNGRVIAEGYHVHPGLHHAEIIAMRRAGSKTSGATLYLTLEPCTHVGRTPPCIDTVLKAGFKRVVIAMRDPNPLVRGKGIRILKKARIKTTLGVLQSDAMRLNEAFVHFMTTGQPFVTIKTAMSIDGKIATRTGDSRGLSDATEQRFVHKLRADSDAIVVGIGTILQDNPRLTARVPGARDPLRVIFDSSLAIPMHSRVLHDSNVLIATTTRASKRKIRTLEKKGISVVPCGNTRVEIIRLLRILRERGVTSILVEGGGEINASFLEAGVVQKIIVPIAAKIIGGRDATTLVAGTGMSEMRHAIRIKNVSVKPLGKDFLFEGYL